MLLTASWQVTILSRNANNGTNDSAFYLNANNDSENQNRNIGTQLAGALNKRGLSNSKVLKSLMSYWGWVKPIDAKALWRTVISTILLNFTDGVFTNNPLRATI